MPTVRSTGAIASGTTSCTPGMPATYVAGDLLVCFAESIHGDTISASGGWVNGPVIPTAANASVDTQLQVFYKVAVGSGGDALTLTSSSGDHVIGRMVAITTGTYNAEIFYFTQTTAEVTADTSGSMTGGMTTAYDDCLVLCAAAVGGTPGADNTSSFSGGSNTSTTPLSERGDNGRVAGSGGHLAIWSGVKTSAGLIANTTFTCVPSAYKAMVMFVLRYPSEGGSFPAVAPSAVAVATQISTASASWSVALPGSIASGDLLVLFLRTGGAHTFNAPAGYTTLVDNFIDDSTDDITSVYYKIATGSEGSSISVSISSAEKGVAFAYRITGVDTAEPVYTIGYSPSALAEANALNPDCNMSVIRNHLWICTIFLDGTSQTFTAPSGFSGTVSGNSGTGGTVASNVRGATCWRQEENFHKSPAAWVNGTANSGHTTMTLGVIPLGPTSTPKSGTDSGSGSETAATGFQGTATDTNTTTETATFTAVATGDDTGVSVENSVLATVNSASDAGTGSDDSTLDRHVTPVSGSDTSSGTDAGTLATKISVSDAGFLTLDDGAVVIAPIVVGDDVGAGSEVISQFTRNFPDYGGDLEDSAIATSVSDSGTSFDEIPALARPLQDAGTGTENFAIVKFVDDTGSGSDGRVNTAAFSGSDSGGGSETSVSAARYTQSETGAGTEALTASVQISGSDAGTGTDAPVIKAVVSGADSGGLAAEVTLLALIITVFDLGTGSEVLALAASLSFSDTGTAVESPLFALLLVDSVNGSDATATSRVLSDFGGITENYAISVLTPSDTGSAVEAISTLSRPVADSGLVNDDSFVILGNTRTGSDSAESVDTASMVFRVTASDSGIGSEISGSNTPVIGSDSGGATEIPAIRIAMTETVIGTDITALGRVLFDTVIGSDGQTISAGNTRQDSDSGHGDENYILNKALPISDSGTGSENGLLIAAFATLDSGSVSENAPVGSAPVRIDDNGQGTDAGQLRRWISGFDGGVGIDRGHAGLFVITKFHTSKLVTANGQDSKLVAANHPYYVGV